MYHKEFVALFHTFLSSGINLTNTFGVKFGVLNGPPLCQMTERPLNLTLSSFVGTRSTCCPVKTMYFSDEKSITDENNEASFKAHSHRAVRSITLFYCFNKTRETIYKSIIITGVVHN